MNTNEISNADLDAIISGHVPTVGEVIALARAELDRRKAEEAKPKPAVEPPNAQALHDKINEIIAAVNRMAKEGK